MAKNQKPTLVFIHGLRGDHHGLRHIYKILSSEFNILHPDLPGYGKNPELADSSLDGRLRWLHKYIKNLPTKPVLIGHSMGSIIVSNYLKKYPNSSHHKTILLSPIFRKKIQQTSDKALYYTLRASLAPLPDQTKHKILASHKVSWVISHFLTFDKSKQQFIDQEHFKYSESFNSAKSLLSDIKISLAAQSVIPEDKEVLIIIGEKDQLTSTKLAKQKALFFKANYKELPQSGHLLVYEAPDQVASLIRDFLS